ncbi:uncharacterized protein VP01_9139g1 [Puccinia sorghi]|uniref:Uncharacterized protein n=1 Tax=Puccinia sorghi TaxID=27349 RepID=A0A0L6U848_9BASI|nr:uncharacterized protein VP01_9139g1 [Puccinia sorghi]
MSLYQNGLKENVQLAVVMRNIQFDSLRSMRVMALIAGQTIEGIRIACPAPNTSTSIPSPDLNVMDLSAFQRGPSNQLSDSERASWVQGNLCFRCGQAGQISRGYFRTPGGNQLPPCQQPHPAL